jgi:alkylation response protein AidB-like acyl-CoA dehydrogenase
VDLELVDCPAILLGADKQEQPIDLSALDMGRLQVAAQALGIAEAAFGVACHYARTRKQFGSLIAQQQMIAFKLADMQVAINAAEMLIYKAAWRRDLGLSYHHASAEAKLFCSEAASIIADQALQIFGGYGYTKEFPVEKYFRDARVTRIYEGTSEIQRLFIGSQLIISETVDCQDKKDSE